MNNNFCGIHAALVTPYTPGDEVNYPELKKLVRHLIEKGIDGFYVAGSTAETFLLTEKERKGILETVLEEAGGKARVICHVGDISTNKAIDFAQHAKRSGADAVSAISPFYYKFSNQEVVRYYLDIMDATDLPMFVYNFPNFSGFSLTEDVLGLLKANEHLAGVKFTSSDMYLLERIKGKNPDLVVWNGFDEMLIAGLMMGADGGVGSTYNCMPGLIRKVYDAFRSGDIVAAQAYQQQANHVIEAICRHGVFASVKTMLGFEGMEFGACRKPFSQMTEEGRQELQMVYNKYVRQYQ